MNRHSLRLSKRHYIPLALGACSLLMITGGARRLRALPIQTGSDSGTRVALPVRREKPVYSLKELAELLSVAEKREVTVDVCSECRYLLIALPDGEKTIRSSDLRIAMETTTGLRWRTVGTKDYLTYADENARQEAVRQAYADLNATRHAIYDKVAKNRDGAWPITWNDVRQGAQPWTSLTPEQQQRYTGVAARSSEFTSKGMASLLSDTAASEHPSVWFTLDMVYRVRHAGGFLINTSQRIAN